MCWPALYARLPLVDLAPEPQIDTYQCVHELIAFVTIR
jgi:hypothetical protein